MGRRFVWHHNEIITSKVHPEVIFCLSVWLRAGQAAYQSHSTIRFPIPVEISQPRRGVFAPLHPPCYFSEHTKLPWCCQHLRLQVMFPRGLSWSTFLTYLLHLTLEVSSALNLLFRCGHIVSLSKSPPAIIPHQSGKKRGVPESKLSLMVYCRNIIVRENSSSRCMTEKMCGLMSLVECSSCT